MKQERRGNLDSQRRGQRKYWFDGRVSGDRAKRGFKKEKRWSVKNILEWLGSKDPMVWIPIIGMFWGAVFVYAYLASINQPSMFAEIIKEASSFIAIAAVFCLFILLFGLGFVLPWKLIENFIISNQDLIIRKQKGGINFPIFLIFIFPWLSFVIWIGIIALFECINWNIPDWFNKLFMIGGVLLSPIILSMIFGIIGKIQGSKEEFFSGNRFDFWCGIALSSFFPRG